MPNSHKISCSTGKFRFCLSLPIICARNWRADCSACHWWLTSCVCALGLSAPYSRGVIYTYGSSYPWAVLRFCQPVFKQLGWSGRRDPPAREFAIWPTNKACDTTCGAWYQWVQATWSKVSPYRHLALCCLHSVGLMGPALSSSCMIERKAPLFAHGSINVIKSICSAGQKQSKISISDVISAVFPFRKMPAHSASFSTFHIPLSIFCIPHFTLALSNHLWQSLYGGLVFQLDPDVR